MCPSTLEAVTLQGNHFQKKYTTLAINLTKCGKTATFKDLRAENKECATEKSYINFLEATQFFIYAKQNVIELKNNEKGEDGKSKPIYSYYKRIIERDIPTKNVVNESIYLKLQNAVFYDSSVSNILNPSDTFNFLSLDTIDPSHRRELIDYDTGLLYRGNFELGPM